MLSRRLLSLPPDHRHRHVHPLLPVVLGGALSLVLLSLILILFIFLYRKLSHNRTAPTTLDLKSPIHIQTANQCRHYSYSLLRRATASFSPSNVLGHGGFGCVYKAVLSSAADRSSFSSLAVKVMDPNGSLQGEREFHNELTLASSLNSPYIVTLLGFSTDRRKRKLVIVYELMENRSLQEALLDRKCEELMDWSQRYSVITDVARGLEYLHHSCNPPVIHGDVKPSNILLDSNFNAKIGDFGLARLKTEEIAECGPREENGSILEEAESLATGYEDTSAAVAAAVDSSPASKVLESDASPEAVGTDKASVSELGFDRASVESGHDLGKKGGSRRDWWWKQDNGMESESGRVKKDYVMEWIGSEISKERAKSGWNLASPSSVDNSLLSTTSLKIEPRQKKRKKKKRLEWWASLDEERLKKKGKNRKPREWWKEEFCDELSKKNNMKKKKKKMGLNLSNGGGESCWPKEEEEDSVQEERKKKRKSRGSIDWWLDGFSGELRNGRRNSQDWASGEIPKSGGVSSTPSMRGTVCYIAPEYGGGGQLSEKCDVYSFGVLLLVAVSGRRPLQVTASPMSEFERANLISWARQLAYNGKLLDLVDPLIHSMDKDQALLCITIALLCLQRSPSKRPSMKDIVEMLSGEVEPPHLPFEFSPSPPSSFPFKSRKKAR